MTTIACVNSFNINTYLYALLFPISVPFLLLLAREYPI